MNSTTRVHECVTTRVTTTVTTKIVNAFDLAFDNKTAALLTGDISNEAGEIHLRDWQEEAYQSYLASTLNNFSINAPTGSGKSKAVMAIIAKCLHSTEHTKFIIAVPQKAIGGGFAGYYDFPDYPFNYSLVKNYCDDGYSSTMDDSKIRAVIEFLEDDSYVMESDRLVLCTHATLSRVYRVLEARGDLDLLKKASLWFDEAHHIMGYDNTVANRLGDLVQYCLCNDVPVNMVTATAFRGDGLPIIPRDRADSFQRYYLPYDRHFEENCRGMSFRYDFVLTQGHWYDGIARVLEGDVRKTIVFLPHPSSNLSTGNKHGEVSKIISLYKGSDVDASDLVEDVHGVMSIVNAAGDVIRVVDLVKDTGRGVKVEYLREHGDDVDVVIGINVPKEGFDWPAAAREIIVGPRGSLTDVIQMLGRTFRAHADKGADKEPVEIFHVLPWVDRAAVDDDELKDKFNTYMTAVMMSLIFEDIMLPPVDVNVPSIKKSVERAVEPSEVMEYVKEVMGDEGWISLRMSAIDACTEYRAQNPDVSIKEANEEYQRIILDMVQGTNEIEEFEEEVTDILFKGFMRSSFDIAKLELTTEHVDLSLLNLDLMETVDAVGGFTKFYLKEFCGALTLREYREIAHGRFIASAEQHREWFSEERYSMKTWITEGYPKYKEQGAMATPPKKFDKPWSWFTGRTSGYGEAIASANQHREWIIAEGCSTIGWSEGIYNKYKDQGAIPRPWLRYTEYSGKWFKGEAACYASPEQHREWIIAEGCTAKDWSTKGIYKKYLDRGGHSAPWKHYKNKKRPAKWYWQSIASAEQHREWMMSEDCSGHQWSQGAYKKYKDQGAISEPWLKYPEYQRSWFYKENKRTRKKASAEEHRIWIKGGEYTREKWVTEGYPKYKDQGAVSSPAGKFKKKWSWFTGNSK